MQLESSNIQEGDLVTFAVDGKGILTGDVTCVYVNGYLMEEWLVIEVRKHYNSKFAGEYRCWSKVAIKMGSSHAS